MLRSDIAIASPITSCIVVDVVGASPLGQASSTIGIFSAIFEDFAK